MNIPIRFPIQGGLTVSWAAAERAYRTYAKRFGSEQTLERLASRGGFGLNEFVGLYSISRQRDDYSIATILAAADVRPKNSDDDVCISRDLLQTMRQTLRAVGETLVVAVAKKEVTPPYPGGEVDDQDLDSMRALGETCKKLGVTR